MRKDALETAIAPAPMDASRAFRADALRTMARIGLGTLAVGGAVRGAQGLFDTASRATAPRPKLPARRQVVEVPVPGEEDDGPATLAGPWKTAALWFAAEKRAETGAAAAPVAARGLATNQALAPYDKALGSLGANNPHMGAGWKWFWHGNVDPQAPSFADLPWGIPGLAAAAVGGGLAGHALAGVPLEAARKKEEEDELAEAKRRYETALAPGGGSALAKLAAAAPHAGDPRAAGYALADRLLAAQKRAGLAERAGGLWMLTAGTAAALAGVGAYNWRRSNSPDKALEEALRRRREQLHAAAPPPLVAVPVPAKAAGLAQAGRGALARYDAQRQRLAQQAAAALGMGEKGGPPKDQGSKAVPPPLPTVVPPPAPAQPAYNA
jgi:hypothetical protein